MNWWLLKRKIHVSWLIVASCCGISIGVFLAQYISNSMLSLTVCLTFSIIMIVISLWQRYLYLIPVLVIGGMLFGLWRGSISQNELARFKPLYGEFISINGTVLDDVDTGSSNQSTVRLGEIHIDGLVFSGVVWATIVSDNIKRGDKLLLSGKLMKGFGNFSGVMYRANIDKIIHPKPGDVARVIRDWFADAIRRVIPDPEASLGIGFLTGQRRSLPDDLVLSLQTVGLTHVVVASGYNLTILVRLARRLFVKISKYLSVLSASVMIVAFISITGVSPSMSRAGLVSSLGLMAWYYGRKFHPIVLLFVSIAITLIINPSYAWGDLGWQLSFLAFAGVMIIAPLMQRYFFGDDKPGIVRQILGETVSAQLATVPVIVASFGQISNVAIVSNLLVLPFVPLAMLLTFVAGISSLLMPIIANFISIPAVWLLHYMIAVTEFLSNLTWAVNVVQLAWWEVLLCYIAIIGGCFYMWRVTKFNLREVNLVE